MLRPTVPELRQRAAHMVAKGHNRLRIMDDLHRLNVRCGLGLELDALREIFESARKEKEAA